MTEFFGVHMLSIPAHVTDLVCAVAYKNSLSGNTIKFTGLGK